MPPSDAHGKETGTKSSTFLVNVMVPILVVVAVIIVVAMVTLCTASGAREWRKDSQNGHSQFLVQSLQSVSIGARDFPLVTDEKVITIIEKQSCEEKSSY